VTPGSSPKSVALRRDSCRPRRSAPPIDSDPAKRLPPPLNSAGSFFNQLGLLDGMVEVVQVDGDLSSVTAVSGEGWDGGVVAALEPTPSFLS